MYSFITPVFSSPLRVCGDKDFVSRRRSVNRQAFARPQTRVTPTCIWVERSATVRIEMPPEEAYDYYIDLEAMPKWSPWLKSVEVDKEDGDVSRWTLASRGITISWKARNTKVKRGEIIAWKSESGLTNRGRVVFSNKDQQNCTVTLAVEFDVPQAIASVINNNEFIGRFVEETLMADMKRFRSVALLNRRRRLRSTEVSTSME